jgi:hypothetical protein
MSGGLDRLRRWSVRIARGIVTRGENRTVSHWLLSHSWNVARFCL